MGATVNIDKAGRIIVPKKLREALHLQPGDELEIDLVEDGLRLRPRREGGRLLRKNGMWVIDTGGRVTPEMVNETLQQVREERERRILGE